MVVTDRALDRESMVERQLRRRGIRDEGVLEAPHSVPREALVGDAVDESHTRTRPSRSRRLAGDLVVPAGAVGAVLFAHSARWSPAS
jgi:protein-L-isoaspartate O-methyltransferase